jgi:hypothetical protein
MLTWVRREPILSGATTDKGADRSSSVRRVRRRDGHAGRATPIRSHDVHEAEAIGGEFLYPQGLEALDRGSPLDLTMFPGRIGPIFIGDSHYGRDVRATCGELDTSYHVNIPAGHPHHVIINRPPSPAGRLVIAQAVACSCEVRAGRIGSTSPIPINEITHANATAHTAFGCRNGLAG